jgi:large subunit ribosomal protein L6
MAKETLERTVHLPEGFRAEAEGGLVRVISPKGEAQRKFNARGVELRAEGGRITITGRPVSKRIGALVGTIESHIKNMAKGLEHGYEYKLATVFSHFPINVIAKGDKVEINNFTGEKKPRYAKIVPGAAVEVKGKDIFVRGNNKEAVSQTAANMETGTKVRGKDRRIYQDGIYLVSKGLKKVQ